MQKLTKKMLLEAIKDCDDSAEVEVLITKQLPGITGFCSYYSACSAETSIGITKDIHNETKIVLNVNVEEE